MTADWTKFCRARGFTVEGDAIDVKLAEGRHQRVSVRDAGEVYELESVVVRRSALRDIVDAPLRAWRRNRSAQLVGFRIHCGGRLVGEGWVPKVGLTPEEFQIYVRRIAAESDRFEYVLTGKDVE